MCFYVCCVGVYTYVCPFSCCLRILFVVYAYFAYCCCVIACLHISVYVVVSMHVSVCACAFVSDAVVCVRV